MKAAESSTVLKKVNDTLIHLAINPMLLGILLILLIIPLFLRSEYTLYLITTIIMMGTLAMCFNFTAGFINIVNFGFAAFVGVGAYTAALFTINLGVTPWVSMFLGAFLSAFCGFIIGLLSLRLRGMFAALMAWFFGIAIMSFVSASVDLTRGALGLNVPSLFPNSISNIPYLYTISIISIIIYVIFRAIEKSNIGLSFKAIGQNLEAAQSLGINHTIYRIINFTVSCFFAGYIGGFYAYFIGILSPLLMHTTNTVEILTICYIGGRGNLISSILAAFLIIPIFETLRPLMEIRLIIYGLMLILLMLYFPGGLAGVYDDIKIKYRSTIAKKN